MKIESCGGHKENQKNGEEPRGEIERNHQAADDLEGANRDGKHLRRRHSRHRFKLRGIGSKKCGNSNLGGDEISGGLNAEKLGRPRIDKKHGEQNSPESNERWHDRPHWMLQMRRRDTAERLWALRLRFSNGQIDSEADRYFFGLAKQGWLLAAGTLLGFDRGNRGHVEDAARGHRRRENMRRPRRANQDRPNRERVG